MEIPQQPPEHRLLTVFHYVSPFIVLLYFGGAQCAAFLSLRLSKAPKATTQQKIAALIFILLTASLYVAEAVLYMTRALTNPGWWASQDLVLYTLESVVVWGIIGITFLDTVPIWFPYLGSFILGGLLEGLSCSLTTTPHNGFEKAGFAIKLARTATLATLASGCAVLIVGSMFHSADEDEERQKLLNGPVQNGNADATKPDYGAISESPSDSEQTSSGAQNGDEEDDDDKEIKEKQRKRLEEEGGWWGYLKGFAAFLPIISPLGDRKMMFFFFVKGLFIIWERFQNILIPNQLGIISRKLADVHGTGVLPWKEVAVWILLRWLPGSAGLGIIESWVQLRIGNFSYARISKFALNHVMGLSMDFHDNKSSGELQKAVEQGTTVGDLIETFAFTIGPLFADMAVGMVYITYLFDGYLTFIVFVTGITYFWATIRLRKLLLDKRRVYIKKFREEWDVRSEVVSEWITVSYFNRQNWECDRFAGSLEDAIQAEYAYLDRHFITSAIVSLIMVLGHMSASYLAVYRVAQGTSDVGSFVTLVTYWGTLIGPLSRLAGEYRRMSSNFVDAERLLQLIQTKPSITTKPGAPDLRLEKGEVEFKDVTFAYDERKQILSDISFIAKPGQTVAFVGETGGGKSTMMKLLCRYYDITGGSITIDGQDIRDVTLNSVREAYGMVPQDSSLFNRSIMENVRYARLGATDEEVMEACKAAAIHDKIETFPDKYKSKVGEHGVKLSGGERQRIAIARVILKNPHIVLLDEATSAVDSSTEQEIQLAFKKLSRSRTTFVIAHRLSTIVEADLILVVEAGKIIERGSHDELLLQDGKYTELWRKQTKENATQSAVVAMSTSSTAAASHENLIVLDDKEEIKVIEKTLEQVDGCCESTIEGAKDKLKGKKKDGEGTEERDGEDPPQPLVEINPRPTYGPAGDKTDDNNDSTKKS